VRVLVEVKGGGMDVWLNGGKNETFFQDLGGRQANSCCRHKSQSEAAWAVEAMPLQLNYRSTIS